MLRPIAIQRYLDTLTQTHGIAPGRLLLGTSLTPEALAQATTLVEPGQARMVVENLLQLSGNRGIGFDIWTGSSLPQIGVIGHATLTSPCIRDAYPVWRRFARALVGLTGSFHITEENADGVTFVFDGLDPLDPLVGFYTEELIGIFAMIGTRLLNEAPAVVNAQFAYRPPQHTDRYHQLLGCPIEFGAARTSITLTPPWLTKPIGGHDPAFHRVCQAHCQSVQDQIEQTMPVSQKVRRVLSQAEGAWPRLDDVAQQLSLSSRTLRRRLQEESTSFQAVVEAQRLELACLWLRNPEVSLKEVAFRLGFDETSSFHHAFKQWTGMPAGQYRQQQQA